MPNNSQNNKKKAPITQADISKLLDNLYDKCLNGIPKVGKSVEQMSAEYLDTYRTKEQAIDHMLNMQIAKCTTSGFVTGFGGLITLPVTLPANVTSVLYVQMRMIACVAHMNGWELNSDVTQTFVYACLAGVAVSDIVKQVGVKFGVKFVNNLVKKIPGKVLTKINQKVGFRFLTKFGTKGLINIGKCVPVVGALIGGGLDLAETKIIAGRAKRWFSDNDFSVREKDSSEKEQDTIVITPEDFEDNND